MDKQVGVAIGRLLLALDRTVATLVLAPRGLDVRISSLAMIDIDDVTFGLGRAARGAELYLLVGLDDATTQHLLSSLGGQHPVAVMAKSPSDRVSTLAERLGIALIAVDPHARWERIYNLVMRLLDAAREQTGESMRSGSTGDLFELAGEVARRTGGLVSIEDERSHVLSYSTAGDEADELRRLSILGREGPPEMLAWLRQWGVMDALRTSRDVITVDERADLGLRSRLVAAIRAPGSGDDLGPFLGAVWLQEGRRPFADDAGDVLIGAAAVAARVIARRRAVGTDHDELVRRLLGSRGEVIDTGHLSEQLGIDPAAAVMVVGFGVVAARGPELGPAALGPVAGQVSALMLHASAFSPLSVTTMIASRAYVVLPRVGDDAALNWARAAVAATDRQFGVRVRAVIAGPADGLGKVPGLRAQVDQVLDAAEREGELIDDVTTVERSRTGVLLGEIVGLLSANPDLVDTRVTGLALMDEESGSQFTVSLQAYLDNFGDVRTAASELHVHPNTLRYRIRRVQELTGMDLDDAATRLVVALSLRAR